MEAVQREAERGKLVIGICNGFQILCEAGLLPGALMRNDSTQFRCQDVHLRVETTRLALHLRRHEGRRPAHADRPRRGQLLRRPGDHRPARTPKTASSSATARPRARSRPRPTPTASLENIAGILNERRNVLGMMPHPERVSEALMGGTDGLTIWRSMIEAGTVVLSSR